MHQIDAKAAGVGDEHAQQQRVLLERTSPAHLFTVSDLAANVVHIADFLP